MTIVAGTFQATGESDTLKVLEGFLALSFGSGTVALERQMASGTWVPIKTYTSSMGGEFIEGKGFSYRLSCTSYVSDIEYEILSQVF